MLNSIILTFDTEWAPDYALDFIAHELIQQKVKATWFITHNSPSIREIIRHSDLFEVGIHPNFLHHTTQGKTQSEILSNLLSIAPDATAVRTHGLVQSSYLLSMMANKYGITTDVSLFLPLTPHLTLHTLHYDHNGTALTRVPYFWEDDIEMYDPHKSWRFSDPKYHVPGLKVFDFHPLYLYLNLNSMHSIEELKKLGSPTKISPTTVNSYRNNGSGIRTMFHELVDYIVQKQKISATISDIVRYWKKTQ